MLVDGGDVTFKALCDIQHEKDDGHAMVVDGGEREQVREGGVKGGVWLGRMGKGEVRRRRQCFCNE